MIFSLEIEIFVDYFGKAIDFCFLVA